MAPGAEQQALVREGQEILRKVGVDPLFGKENLVWAPMRAVDQHHINTLRPMVEQMRALQAAGGAYEDFVVLLNELGRAAAARR